MNAKNITHIIFFGVVMMLCSCARDHLYYDAKSRNLVQLNIDWSQTAFWEENAKYNRDNPINGVTVFAFDSETHQFAKELPPDANWHSPRINLDPGTYNLIVINDSRVELPNINLNTEQNFEDFSAYIAADTVFNNEYPDYLTVSSVLNVLFEPPYNADEAPSTCCSSRQNGS